MNGVPVAVIGQAFPFTPIANPRWMVPDWSFGIHDDHLQKMADECPLAVTESLLYRRGNFNGTFDQIILDALLAVTGAEIALPPGFR